jgi:cyclopropane fatty-acyl-phospholipid synthase-like methyltransferase
MSRDLDEKALFDRFSKKYQLVRSELLIKIERSNCGCDYGSTSFTTVGQVEILGQMLALGPKKRLLEVGAGSGWPGLYLARESGCDVTLTDLPIEGLLLAKERAVLDQLSGTSEMVIASGSALPFQAGSFDAISHADVLCCLVPKLEVLKACREVVNPGGRMVFTVILTTPGLSESAYLKAVECGPTFIAAEDSYPSLIEAAGWELVDQLDLSTEFLETLQVMQDNELRHADDLENLLGKEETLRRLTRSQESIYGLEHNLIKRELFRVVPA